MKSNFKYVQVNTDSATCDECKQPIKRGSAAFASFTRDRTGTDTTFVCSAECLAESKNKGADKMLNRMSVQFN